MRAFFSIIITVLGLNFAQAQEAKTTNSEEEMTTYFFIRHAEKDATDPQNRDPQLSDKGVERVKKWIELFKETELDQVYSTNYYRTKGTATPIANSKDLEVQIYDPRNLNDEDFQQKTKGKTVLVVGHSNTNPHFVNAILKQKKYSDIDEAESGTLFVVTVAPSGEATSHLLYFN